MNWQFYSITQHYKIGTRRFINTILQSESSWCDWCVLAPLFQLYSGEKCTDCTDVHIHGNDSDSDDSSINIYEKYNLSNPT